MDDPAFTVKKIPGKIVMGVQRRIWMIDTSITFQ
jgi:hypothetical protein